MEQGHLLCYSFSFVVYVRFHSSWGETRTRNYIRLPGKCIRKQIELADIENDISIMSEDVQKQSFGMVFSWIDYILNLARFFYASLRFRQRSIGFDPDVVSLPLSRICCSRGHVLRSRASSTSESPAAKPGRRSTSSSDVQASTAPPKAHQRSATGRQILIEIEHPELKVIYKKWQRYMKDGGFQKF
jgi:hypothetical protein